MQTSTIRSAAFTLALVTLTVNCGENPATEAPVTAQNAPELLNKPASIGGPGEGIVAEFTRRINDYAALRKQLDETLDKVPDKATPRQIDVHQRALGALMAKARSDARAGDIFVPDMQKFIRGLVRQVVTGPDGGRIKASLLDENPMSVTIAVNGRYPDTVPLSTMPPDVLAALPSLPEDLEYRFVGTRLIILDNRSHLIVDFVENTFDV